MKCLIDYQIGTGPDPLEKPMDDPTPDRVIDIGVDGEVKESEGGSMDPIAVDWIGGRPWPHRLWVAVDLLTDHLDPIAMRAAVSLDHAQYQEEGLDGLLTNMDVLVVSSGSQECLSDTIGLIADAPGHGERLPIRQLLSSRREELIQFSIAVASTAIGDDQGCGPRGASPHLDMRIITNHRKNFREGWQPIVPHLLEPPQGHGSIDKLPVPQQTHL